MTGISLSNFEELKNLKKQLKNENSTDMIDFDNGTMIIQRKNLNKYLERYSCKNEQDLSDTMWFNYGVFVKIVD